MSRKEAFNILWKYLEGKFDCTILYDKELNCQVKDVGIELIRQGEHYEYQIYLANMANGFTTIDVQVLLEEIEDHEWCWSILKYLGFKKEMLDLYE